MGREAAGRTLGKNPDLQASETGRVPNGDPAASKLQEWQSTRTAAALAGWPANRTAEPLTSRLQRALAASFLHELERGAVFLFVPVFLGIGVILYFSLTVEPGFWSLGLAAGIVTLVAWFCRKALPAQLLVSALLAIVLGLIAAKFETWRADTKVLGSEITTRLTGTVVLVERRANGQTRLTMDVLKTERPELRYQPDRIRATTRSAAFHIHPGAQIRGISRLRPPPGPVRPGSYDFSRENYFDGLGANGFFLSAVETMAGNPPTGFRNRLAIFLAELRDRLSTRIAGTIGGREGAIAAALITGTKAGIPDDVNEALRRTGLAHILSISGLHMALVAGFVMLVLRAGFGVFPAFSSRHPVKKYAATAALVAVFFYLFVSGTGVATQRSFIMLAVMLVALLFDRAAITMRNLAISATVVILIAPHEVIGPSFQMSFAATAALIAAYAAWSERRERNLAVGNFSVRQSRWEIPRTILRYGAGLAFTSLIAGTATALFAAYHFHRIAPYGLVANLAAMPAVSVLVMPSAVLSMLLMPFDLDGIPLAVMGWGISLVIGIAEWLSERTVLDEVGLLPVEAVAVLSCGLVLLTVLTSRLRLVSIPVIVIGLLMTVTRQEPGVLVSEDARLVAVKSGSATLAVNRKRPNAFTLNNWKRALRTPTVEKPVSDHDGDGVFSCTKELCIIRHDEGRVLVHTKSVEAASKWCRLATIPQTVCATANDVCPGVLPAVITKRQLARRGSASIVFHPSGKGTAAQIDHAVGEPYRPWHRHRAFSRAARGMPPWKRKKTGAGDKTRPASK